MTTSQDDRTARKKVKDFLSISLQARRLVGVGFLQEPDNTPQTTPKPGSPAQPPPRTTPSTESRWCPASTRYTHRSFRPTNRLPQLLTRHSSPLSNRSHDRPQHCRRQPCCCLAISTTSHLSTSSIIAAHQHRGSQSHTFLRPTIPLPHLVVCRVTDAVENLQLGTDFSHDKSVPACHRDTDEFSIAAESFSAKRLPRSPCLECSIDTAGLGFNSPRNPWPASWFGS